MTHVHLHDLDKTFLLLLEQELSNLFFVPLASSAMFHRAVMPETGRDPECVTRVHLVQNQFGPYHTSWQICSPIRWPIVHIQFPFLSCLKISFSQIRNIVIKLIKLGKFLVDFLLLGGKWRCLSTLTAEKCSDEQACGKEGKFVFPFPNFHHVITFKWLII